MALFTAVAGSILLGSIGSFAVGSAFVATVGAFVLNTAVGLGLGLLAQQLAGKPKTAPFAIKGTLRTGGDIPRSYIYGRAATAGSLVYANTWGKVGKTPNAYLTQVIALSDLPVDALNGVWIDGSPVTIGGTLDPDGRGYPLLEYRREGIDFAWAKFYDGTQTTADTFLTGTVASADRPYQSTRVGVGVAYVILTTRVDAKFFTQIPQARFELAGRKLYDPSKDTTVGGSGSHRYDTPSTWGGDGDDFPIVQLYDLMRGVTYGGEWFYGMQTVGAPQLPAAAWIAAIAKCRATVTEAGGAAPAFTSGGEIIVSATIAEAVEALLTACHGRLGENGVTLTPQVAAPGSPVASFSDDDIISTEGQSFTPFFGLADSINGVSGVYPSPEENWNITSAPPLFDTDMQAEDGGRRLMADVRMDMVFRDEQAQRLMRMALREARRSRRHSIVLPPQFAGLEPGDVVEWTSPRNGYTTKRFRVDGVADGPNLDVPVDLTEINPDDYGWTTGTDFTEKTRPPTIRVLPDAFIGGGWSVTAVGVTDAAGANRRPAIRLEWDTTPEGVLAVAFQIRVDATGTTVARGWTPDYEAGSTIIAEGLLAATAYEVRGRYKLEGEQETDWSAWMDVTTLNLKIDTADISPGSITAALLDSGVIDAIENATGDGFAYVVAAEAARDAAIAAQGLAEDAADDALAQALIASDGAQEASEASALAVALAAGGFVVKSTFEDTDLGEWAGVEGNVTLSNIAVGATAPWTRAIQLGGTRGTTYSVVEGPLRPGNLKGRTIRFSGRANTVQLPATAALNVGLRVVEPDTTVTDYVVLAYPEDTTWGDFTVDVFVPVETRDWQPLMTLTGGSSGDAVAVRLVTIRGETWTQAAAAAVSSSAAQVSEDAASISAGAASSDRVLAEAARDAALGHSDAAAEHVITAGAYSDDASEAADAAITARTLAQSAKADAETAADASTTARDFSQSYADDADGFASAASTSASTASVKADEALASADTALAQASIATNKAAEASFFFGAMASLSAANMVIKGDFEDTELGEWTSGLGTLNNFAASDAPWTRAMVYTGTRLTTGAINEGPLRNGNLNGRTFRVTGRGRTLGSVCSLFVGLRTVRADGSIGFRTVQALAAGQPYTDFSVEVTEVEDTVQWQPRIARGSEGVDASAVDLRLTWLRIEDITEARTESTAAVSVETAARVSETETLARFLVRTELLSGDRRVITGFGFESSISEGGTPESEFEILADTFKVVAPPSISGQPATTMFAVQNVNGTPQVTVAGTLYADNIISTRTVAANAVTEAATAQSLSVIAYPSGTAWNNIIEVDLDRTVAGFVSIWFSIATDPGNDCEFRVIERADSVNYDVAATQTIVGAGGGRYTLHSARTARPFAGASKFILQGRRAVSGTPASSFGHGLTCLINKR